MGALEIIEARNKEIEDLKNTLKAIRGALDEVKLMVVNPTGTGFDAPVKEESNRQKHTALMEINELLEKHDI